MEITPEVLKKSVESLLKLQEIDAQLFQIRTQEAQPSEEYTQVQTKLADAQRVYKNFDKAFRDVDRERRSFELRQLTMTEDLKKTEAKKRDLRNTKEEFAANKEYDNFHKRIVDNKKALDEKTELANQKMAARDENKKTLDTLEVQFKELEAKRAADLKNLEAQRLELQKQRDQYISAVDEQVFALYERVQKLRKGSGVAIVKGAICSGCFVSLPPQIRMRLDKMAEIITCPSCSRILYPEAEASHLNLSSAETPTSGGHEMKMSQAAH